MNDWNSIECKYDLAVDNYYMRSNKDEDGKCGIATVVLDLDMDKENLEAINHLSYRLLRYDDRFDSIDWNSSGNYFSRDSLL